MEGENANAFLATSCGRRAAVSALAPAHAERRTRRRTPQRAPQVQVRRTSATASLPPAWRNGVIAASTSLVSEPEMNLAQTGRGPVLPRCTVAATKSYGLTGSGGSARAYDACMLILFDFA